jgi:hypothetical protein
MEVVCIAAGGRSTDSRHWKERTLIALIVLLAAAAPVAASRALDDYVAGVERRIRQQEASLATFLAEPEASAAVGPTGSGRSRVVVEPSGSGAVEVRGGLIHDWSGAVFIPGATVAEVLAVVQDYDHLARYYSPVVLRSRLMARHGDDFQIAMRLQEREIVTATIDSEYQVHFGRLDSDHQFSFSRSTRLAEIADAGGRHEHAVADAESHGYLWRLNAYWRFAQRGDGVVVECEAVSLTRDVPAGLGWLVGPVVRRIPRESLQATLGATRDAVLARGDSDRANAADRR